MKTKTTSKLNGTEYFIKDVVRIINPRQQTLYIKHNLYPVDMYASLDQEGKDIIVMIFDREASKDLFDAWCNHELR